VGRLESREYYILLALAGSDKHGQAIARDAERLSAGEQRLWPASLYGALESLSEQGWIEELPAGTDDRPDPSHRKRFYRITGRGYVALATETRRLASVVKLARARIKVRSGEAG